MHVQIRDRDGFAHTIDTSDWVLLGRWLAEKTRLVVMSASHADYGMLIVMPSAGPTWDAECAILQNRTHQLPLNKPSLKPFLAAIEKLYDQLPLEGR